MVTIIDYKSRRNSDGEDFFVLVVQGGVKPVVSKETGKVYFTISKANVPTTFNESACRQLVGEEIDGFVEKVECEPYEYEVESTGEVIELSHRYEYLTEEQKLMKEQVVEEEEVF